LFAGLFNPGMLIAGGETDSPPMEKPEAPCKDDFRLDPVIRNGEAANDLDSENLHNLCESTQFKLFRGPHQKRSRTC
jgi:hypothetical protein